MTSQGSGRIGEPSEVLGPPTPARTASRANPLHHVQELTGMMLKVGQAGFRRMTCHGLNDLKSCLRVLPALSQNASSSVEGLRPPTVSAEEGQYPKDSQRPSPFNLIVVGSVSTAGCLHPVSHIKTILPPPCTNHSATRIVSWGPRRSRKAHCPPHLLLPSNIPSKIGNFTATSGRSEGRISTR